MSESFIGEIRIFGFNFAPRNWAMCNGQLLPIQQNTALFSILGTTYGGNGTTNFALPNLQGRAPIHQGQGPGLTQRFLGEEGGTTNVTLSNTGLPMHTHFSANTGAGNQSSPTNHSWAAAKALRQTVNLYSSTSNATISPGSPSLAGGNQPHNNLSPYLVLNFCIGLFGVFPSRN